MTPPSLPSIPPRGGPTAPAPDVPLSRIVLHIGTTKSGTSYIQQVLCRNHDLLGSLGVLSMNKGQPLGVASREMLGRRLDGRPTRDDAELEADIEDASSDALDDTDGGADAATESVSTRAAPSNPGDPVVGRTRKPTPAHRTGRGGTVTWDHLAETMRSWNGSTVVVSNELLSFSKERTAAAIVESLAPHPVTIVITARDLARVIPSAWQNKVKHGRGWHFDSFIESIRKDPSEPRGAGRAFWHQHNIAEIAARWAELVGSANVVIVPVPPRGAEPDELWRRFATILGVPPDDFDTKQDRRSNLSLGFVEAELVRKLNRELRGRMSSDLRHVLVQHYLANQIMRPDPANPRPVTTARMSAETHDWATARAHATVAELRSLGVSVAGDLNDLIPVPLTAAERAAAVSNTEPPSIPAEVVHVVAAMLTRLAELEAAVSETGELSPKAVRRSTKAMMKRDARRQARAERRRHPAADELTSSGDD